jgi:transposase
VRVFFYESMQGRKDYQEKLFVSFQLSQYVPQDNFYRRLKEVLDLHWLYKATEKYYGSEGQKPIDPIVFMKLMLIGYLENLGSDRRIMNTVRLRLDMLCFLGFDLDEALPWHSTLSRTRQLYSENVFKELFLQVLKECIQKGLVAGKRQAVDSVHVKANASMDSLKEKEIIADAATYALELKEEDVDEGQCNNDNSDNNQTVSAQKHQEVQWHHGWKAKACKGMPGARKQSEEGTGEEDKYLPKFVSNHTHYSTTDPDARVAVKPGKPRQHV